MKKCMLWTTLAIILPILVIFVLPLVGVGATAILIVFAVVVFIVLYILIDKYDRKCEIARRKKE